MDTWYAQNKERSLANQRAYRARNPQNARCHALRYAAARRKFVQGLKNKPCLVCGVQFHFACMDFHHTGDDKHMDVAKMASTSSREAILAEVNKCVVLCANCHRLVTHLERIADDGTREEPEHSQQL